MRSRFETNEAVLNAAFNRNQREHDPRFRDPERALSVPLEADGSSKDRKVARWKRRPPPPRDAAPVPGHKREAASGMEWNGMPAACELHSWHELSTTRHPIDPPLTELLLPFRPEHVRTFFTVASVLVERWTAHDATISPRSTTFSPHSPTVC